MRGCYPLFRLLTIEAFFDNVCVRVGGRRGGGGRRGQDLRPTMPLVEHWWIVVENNSPSPNVDVAVMIQSPPTPAAATAAVGGGDSDGDSDGVGGNVFRDNPGTEKTRQDALSEDDPPP